MLESLVQLSDVSPLFFRTNVVSASQALSRVCLGFTYTRQ